MINNSVADCSITVDFVQSLFRRYPTYYKRSRSRGQRSRLQRENVIWSPNYSSPFRKLGSLNLMAMSEFWSEA